MSSLFSLTTGAFVLGAVEEITDKNYKIDYMQNVIDLNVMCDFGNV